MYALSLVSLGKQHLGPGPEEIGLGVGKAVGDDDGAGVGISVGNGVGADVGFDVGSEFGLFVGSGVGEEVGIGVLVSGVGEEVGIGVGFPVGSGVGLVLAIVGVLVGEARHPVEARSFIVDLTEVDHEPPVS